MQVASGATLAAFQSVFANAGMLTGTGTVSTFRSSDALVNSGTIDPGLATAAIGTLTIAGGLAMAAGSVLHIDLAGDAADMLVVTDSVTWRGELALSGDVTRAEDAAAPLSFVIASYGQRLASSSFDRITWNGIETTAVSLDYGANQLTLHVSAVPEPAGWLLLTAGIGVLHWRRRPVGRQGVPA